MSESVKNHFDTGLILSDGWKIGRFPAYGDEKRGSPQNSKSQIIVKKKDSEVRMYQVDGRLGGGYKIVISRNTPKKYDSLVLFKKKYDETLDTIHALMRLMK